MDADSGLQWPDYLLFVLLSLVYALIGIYHGYSNLIKNYFCPQKNEKKETTTDDIFLGNRTLTLLPIIGTTMASFLSAVSLLGNNSEYYRNGLEFCYLILGYMIAFPLAAELHVPVLYNLKISSGFQYLELRYNYLVRFIATIIFTFHMLIYSSVALYAPALALSEVTGYNMILTILLTGIFATFYTAMGGLRAVVWTDLVQIIVMIIGFVLIITIGAHKLGGLHNIWQIAKRGGRVNFNNFNPDPFTRHTFWTLVFGGAGMVLSIYASNQVLVQRYLACKDLRTAKLAVHSNLPLNSIFLLFQALGGMVAYATFSTCDPKLEGKIKEHDQLFPHLIMHLFKDIPAIRGLFISTIFAAALSTLSSGINSIAFLIIEDIFKQSFVKLGKSHVIQNWNLAIPSRILAVLVGILVTGLSFLLKYVPLGILQLTLSLFGSIGGPIFSVFTIGMLFPFVNQWGGLFGLILSLIGGVWISVASIFGQHRPSVTLPLGDCTATSSFKSVPTISSAAQFHHLSYLYYTAFTFIIALVSSTVISLLTGMNSKKPISQSLLSDKVVKIYSFLPTCVKPQSVPSHMKHINLYEARNVPQKFEEHMSCRF